MSAAEYSAIRFLVSVVRYLKPKLVLASQGAAFLLTFLLCGTVLADSSALAWQNWEMQSRLRCPHHHVEQLCDACGLDLVESFEATLSKKTQRRIDRLADTGNVCKDEVAGFSCEVGASITAYEKLGLMPVFIEYGCRHVTCDEDGMCKTRK